VLLCECSSFKLHYRDAVQCITEMLNSSFYIQIIHSSSLVITMEVQSNILGDADAADMQSSRERTSLRKNGSFIV
jgi:hypothetical protein